MTETKLEPQGQDYDKITKKLHEESKKLLADSKIKYIIGWKSGSYGLRISPAFVENEREIENLLWSPFCINSLAVYPTLDEKLPLPRGTEEDKRKIVITVKGCDSRGLVQMFVENGYPRDRMIILGIPCTGQIDPEKLLPEILKNGAKQNVKLTDIQVKDRGEKFELEIEDLGFEIPKLEVIYDKCITCKYPNPIVSDLMLSPPVEPRGTTEDQYVKVEELASMTDEERWSYWAEKFQRCIRCYACREICPVCYCKECLTDKWEPDWINKSVNLTENTMFHLMRAFHLAGRCVGCHECERACPVDIPLLDIYKRLEQDILDNFNYEPGTDPDAITVLTTFNPDDPGEFIL